VLAGHFCGHRVLINGNTGPHESNVEMQLVQVVLNLGVPHLVTHAGLTGHGGCEGG
jgi:hypothetical protein